MVGTGGFSSSTSAPARIAASAGAACRWMGVHNTTTSTGTEASRPTRSANTATPGPIASGDGGTGSAIATSRHLPRSCSARTLARWTAPYPCTPTRATLDALDRDAPRETVCDTSGQTSCETDCDIVARSTLLISADRPGGPAGALTRGFVNMCDFHPHSTPAGGRTCPGLAASSVDAGPDGPARQSEGRAP